MTQYLGVGIPKMLFANCVESVVETGAGPCGEVAGGGVEVCFRGEVGVT